MIQGERIKKLNDQDLQDGKYVLYWMQASVRENYNHALEYAIRKSNDVGRPLVAFFGVAPDYSEANLRHFTFLFEGLKETSNSLAERGVPLGVKEGSPMKGVLKLARMASLVVTDLGYTRLLRSWRRKVAESIPCPLIQVESEVVVPVEQASNKGEYAARTLRPKLQAILDKYLKPLSKTELEKTYEGKEFASLNLSDPRKLAEKLKIDHTVKPVKKFRGGYSQAKALLEEFMENKLDDYDELRNDPAKEYQSGLSPYLHFGHISPLEIALKIDGTDSPGKDAFLEELIIRRELAINYVYYHPDYDSLEGLPDWAKKTLDEHREDPREYIYHVEEFEKAETHDPYWNAAQKEMVLTGKMHGYMRMYWGKKILEWTEKPETAFDIALYLNNKYELDGRDPNSYAGVAWCFGKHDRAWKERPVYGKVRYMNDRGLERKFDIQSYVETIKKMNEG
ncbi:MAG: deoxyribodipyrimidine photo-lyase [Thermoproteota archaeon]